MFKKDKRWKKGIGQVKVISLEKIVILFHNINSNMASYWESL